MGAIILKHDHISAKGPEMWVQEAVFGHRFIEEQKAFMLVLEVLAIARVLQVDDHGKSHSDVRIFDHPRSGNAHEDFTVPVLRARALRYILFKDSSLDQILSNSDILPDQRLEAWIAQLDEGYKASVRNDPITFDYLRERFEDRFDDVVQAIRILRGLELDAISMRRWTSRFLAPRGPNLHFADVDEKLSADRRFFGRGGEMVYLMLNRSRHADRLGEIIRNQFFEERDPLDRVARALVPPSKVDISPGGPLGYLPVADHPSYDRIAEDWLSILELSELPIPQKLEPIFRITALDLVRYFSERSHEVTGMEEMDPLPLDVTSGAITDLRNLSKSYLQRLRRMIDDATEAYIRQTLEAMPIWETALNHDDPVQRTKLARDAISNAFQYAKVEELDNQGDPEKMLEEFVSLARNRRRNAISTLVEPLGKQAGFIDSKQRIGSWFSVSDEMLEALVLARVKGPKTIPAFLEDLYDRYRIVIGPSEARRAFKRPACDISSFEENLRMLEKRLTGLGYVKRLSDDCAFVSNPYWTART